MKQQRPALNVYVAAIPETLTLTPLFPPERQKEIEEVRNETLRRERYCVWKLLERALDHTFGLKMEDLSFQKQPEGKWICDRVHFSQSHSVSAVAVAVSNAPVGVDLEGAEEFFARFADPARLLRLEKKVCTAGELAELRDVSEFLALWTKKEAIFKCFGMEGVFLPDRIDTRTYASSTRMVALPERYSLSVCAVTPERPRFYIADADGIRPMGETAQA